jgi:hypothetical protein
VGNENQSDWIRHPREVSPNAIGRYSPSGFQPARCTSLIEPSDQVCWPPARDPAGTQGARCQACNENNGWPYFHAPFHFKPYQPRPIRRHHPIQCLISDLPDYWIRSHAVNSATVCWNFLRVSRMTNSMFLGTSNIAKCGLKRSRRPSRVR